MLLEIASKRFAVLPNVAEVDCLATLGEQQEPVELLEQHS